MNWLAVFIGGGLGSLCRYGVSVWFAGYFERFPFSTLISNVTASLILVAMVWMVGQKMIQPGSWLILLLTVGFCGGFSTFSTFSLETVQLIRNGNTLLAIANMLISVIACVFVIWIILRKS